MYIKDILHQEYWENYPYLRSLPLEKFIFHAARSAHVTHNVNAFADLTEASVRCRIFARTLCTLWLSDTRTLPISTPDPTVIYGHIQVPCSPRSLLCSGPYMALKHVLWVNVSPSMCAAEAPADHVRPNPPFTHITSCSPADFSIPYRAYLLVYKG
jgi:hypothetical protein